MRPQEGGVYVHEDRSKSRMNVFNRLLPLALTAILLLSVLGVGVGVASAGGWGYSRNITIDHNKVNGSTNLSSFPLLLNLSGDWLKTTANGGNVNQSDGGDVVFTTGASPDYNDVKLDHEIERYNGTAGELQAWVRIPTLKYNQNTPIRLWYGNSDCADQQNPAGVWDTNYKMVQHLQESPANDAAGHIDSTSNPNDGTPKNFGSVEGSTTNATGQIDGADVFDGTDDYVSLWCKLF